MTSEMMNQPNTTFDFGGHHVAAMAQVSHSLKAAQPHATVALTVDAVDLTPPLTAHVRTYAQVYPVARLSKAVDQIFVMAYDLWASGQQCAGPNSPLPEVKKSVQSYIESGADPSSLVLGIPWYGYEYRCNSSLTPNSSGTPIPCKVPGLGSPRCLTGTRVDPLVEYLGVSTWAMEAMLAEGCTKGWSDEFASAFVNCPIGTGPWQNASSTWPGDHRVPYGKGNCWERPSKGCGAIAKWSQTWYDDVRSTKAKAAAAKALKLGGVGVFTGEGAGVGPSAAEYWAALGSVKTDDGGRDGGIKR
jgi:GH18 family chitinase